MSAYGKPQPPPLHGYDASRTFPESSFPYVAPSYGPASSVPSSTAPSFQNTPQITQMAYASNPARTQYDDQSGPYLNVGSTPIPQVTSYAPSRGAPGTKIFVYITSLYELITTNSPVFFLMFGQRKCGASVTKASQHGGVCQYQITTEVPQFSATSWSSAQVPVSMFMETGDGDVIAKVNVGHFTYVDGELSGENPANQDPSRKRKISMDSAELMKSPAKRISGSQTRSKDEYGFPYTPVDVPPYSPYMQQNTAYGNQIAQYNRAAPSYQPSSRHLGFQYSSSTASSSPTIKAPSPQVSNWTPAYPSLPSNMARSPGVPSNVGPHRPSLSSLPSPAVAANPPLIRTSTLQQTPSPATTPHGAHAGQNFNAYALYPHKAKLELNGDLDAMARNWTGEEWDCKRRLVHFKRSQSGSTITTSFHPVTAEDRPPQSICISCIYWEEKNECFVTSVDTIYLLEQLVAARFTVEEKNRIRRNLEGFRPLTVSKGKPDSEEFFKVIMAFPNPKPRNIEKDVKVFHWKDLASALKKIIGKYSASPSSTLPPAPALLTPVSSTGYSTDASAGISYVGDHHGALSPRSMSVSTTSTAYASNIPARVGSPHHQKPMAGLQGGPPNLRVSVPHPHETPSHWQGVGHHMSGSQQYHLGSQSARPSWDMTGYLEDGSASAGGASTPQTLNYATTRNLADVAGAGGENRIVRNLTSQQQSHQMPRA